MIKTQPKAATGEKLQRTEALTQWLHELIAFEGPIGADAFMRWALYHPEFGYYNHLTSIGRGGDFVTAPTLSPVFSESLAAFYQSFLKKQNASGDALPCQVLEIGAGTGALAQHFISYCEQNKIDVTYSIYEPSPSLKKIQQKTLPDNVIWLDSWPEDFSGLVLANEVLDALPVKSFEFNDNHEIQERVIASNGTELYWETKPLSPMLQFFMKEIDTASLMSGQIFEASLESAKWLLQLSHSLKKAFVLLFDYGDGDRHFFDSNRQDGTLRAFYEQQVLGDILWQPGLCDITADVNFTDIAIHAEAADFHVAGMTTQAYFMLENQVENMKNPQHNFELKELLMPGSMGERFKVMALAKGMTADFIFQHDLRKDL